MKGGFFQSEGWARFRWPLLALGLLLAFNFFFTPGFFQLEIRSGRLIGSLVDILNRGTPVILLAIGMTLVIATGGVDLSVGAIMALTGSLAAYLITQTGLHWSAVLAVALAAGALAGAWNGMLVAWAGVQPIVATLILMVAGRGMAQLITQGQIITFENPQLVFLGGGNFLGLPFNVTLAVLLLLVAIVLTRKTALGLFIEAVGDNESASRYSGLPTRTVKLAVYAFSGFCAGLAGVIVASDIKAADANNAGLWLELDAILAAVIGGTALTGGKFFLLSSVVGALLVQTLTTTILTRGVPVEYTLVVKAAVILVVCLMQAEKFRQSFRWSKAT